MVYIHARDVSYFRREDKGKKKKKKTVEEASKVDEEEAKVALELEIPQGQPE